MPAPANTILAFDCSTGPCSVALWQGGVLAYAQEESTSKQASRLIPMIETLLREHNLWYGDLAGIATTVGPGSFTGIRIGLASAKALAMAAKLPIAGITTLEVVAHEAKQHAMQTTAIIAALNAGKGQIYRQAFDARNGLMPLHTPDMVDYADILRGLPDQAYCIVGNGTKLLPALPPLRPIETVQYPDAKALAAIAAANNARFMPYQQIAPLYIRPPDAKTTAELNGIES